MTPLDLDEIEALWMRTGASVNFQGTDCRCDDKPHDNALHDLVADHVPALIARIRELETEVHELMDEAGNL